MKNLKLAALSIAMISSGVQAADAPKYVIYLIGDGLASTQRQVSEYYLQHKTGDDSARLVMNSFPVSGINTTHSLDSLVTDSAASATSLAAGVKTDNGMIAMLPDGTKVRTILDAAQDKGMATGLVTTTRLTHATPAAFASKNVHRDNENEIADDYLASNVDYFAGGGYRHFVSGDQSRRSDTNDLVAGFQEKGYKTFVGEDTTTTFRGYEPIAGDKVFAAFTSSHLPYEIDRQKDNSTPSLAELTEKGFDLLKQNEDGFFIMIEGGRIDHAAHANDIASTVYDTLAFDQAVAKAVDFYHQFPEETLIVVAGDHETGGMGMGFGNNYFMNMENIVSNAPSIEDELQGKYQGDKKAFFSHIKEAYNLENLDEEEIALINTAMKAVDEKDPMAKENYGGYDPVAIAVAHITSKRAGIYWTSFAHTATQLPLSAMGVQADKFGGFKDNTDVANAFADVMNVKIGAEI